MKRRLRTAGLLLAATLALAGCKTELNSGLSEREANEIVALLMRNGVPASRAAQKDGTDIVYVEQSRFADAVDLLRSHGLPRQHYQSIADVFKGNGLVSSPTEERARLMYALGEELSHTVSQIDGVLSARVAIVLPDNDPLRENAQPSSASVFIRYAPEAKVADLVPQIKMLIANGVAGLSYDKVSVVMVPAPAAAPSAPAPDPVVPLAGLYVSRDSVLPLEMIGAAGGALILLLGGIAGWLGWRQRGERSARGLVLR
jgi:type III secretion protein J